MQRYYDICDEKGNLRKRVVLTRAQATEMNRAFTDDPTRAGWTTTVTMRVSADSRREIGYAATA